MKTLRLTTSKNSNYATLLLTLLACAMLALFSWIPHGQSPDEGTHIFRAASLAHGNVLLDVRGMNAGDDINQGLIEYYSKYGSLAFHPERKAQQIKDVRNIRFGDTYEYRNISTAGLYLPLSYAPQALAIFIGEKTHMKVWKAINLARGFNLLAIAGMLFAAVKLWRMPLTACLLLLMPMTTFQMGSASSDGTHFAMTVLITSLFFSLDENFTKTKFFWLCALIFVIATHRINMAVLVLLPLWLAWKYRSRKQMGATVLLGIAIVAWILLAMLQIPQKQQATGMAHVALYYLSHPLDTVKIFCRTFRHTGLLHFYRDSFAGILGWLDYRVNQKFIYLTHALLWLGVAVSCWRNKVFCSWKNSSVFLMTVAALSFLLTFVLLLVQWTKFPCTDVIQGVQGRYFICGFILLCFAAERKQPLSFGLVIGQGKIPVSHWLVMLYGVVSIYATQTATIHRYWLPL